MKQSIFQRYAKLRSRWLTALIVLLGGLPAMATTIEFDSSAQGESLVATSDGTSYYYLSESVYANCLKSSGTSSPAYNSSSRDVRLYAKNVFTIYSDSEPITSVIFTLSSQGKKRATTLTCTDSEGAMCGDVEYNLDEEGLVGDYIEWIGEAYSLVITIGEKAVYGSDGNLKAGQLCFTSMTITTLGEGEGEVTPTVDAPQFYPGTSSFYDPITVSIAAASECSIRYTLDGTTPTATVGNVYDQPLTISATTTVKAVAVDAEGFASSVAIATYTCTKHGIGEGWNPDSPSNPEEPEPIAKKYPFSVSGIPASLIYLYQCETTNWETKEKYAAGTEIFVQADLQSSLFKFTGWMLDGEIISTDKYFYYIMPEHEVQLVAMAVYDPQSPANPEEPVLSHPVTAVAMPATGASMYYPSEKVKEGETFSISAYVNSKWKFDHWELNGEVLDINGTYFDWVMGTKPLHFVCHLVYDPESPGNPSSNYWNPITGEVILDDYTPGNEYSTICDLIDYEYDLVKKITVVGPMDSNALNYLKDEFSNLTTLNLKKVTGMTSLKTNAFSSAVFSNLVLPATIETVNYTAFAYCESLSQLTIYAKVPPTVSASAFRNFTSQSTCTLQVPKESVELYKAADGWKDFFEIVEIPSLIDLDEWQTLCDLQGYLKENGWKGNWKLAAGPDAIDIEALDGVTILNGHVISLDLSGQDITAEFPALVWRFPYLRILNLSNNNLTGDAELLLQDIATDWPQLVQTLEVLNLSQNKLSGNAGYFSAFTALTSLDISSNRFSQIDPMLPAALTLKYSDQAIDQVLDFNLATLTAQSFMSQVPSILLYDHAAQSYVTAATLHLISKTDVYPTGKGKWGAYYYISGNDISIQKNSSWSSYSNVYYGQPGDLINIEMGVNLTGSSPYTTMEAVLNFPMGDGNFDGVVNVLDLQSTINYAFEAYSTQLPFNFTAANLNVDAKINVQDVVLSVGMLLDNENQSSSGMRSLSNGEITDEAIAYCEAGMLVISAETPVAAFDITLRDCSEFTAAKWLKEQGFTVKTSQQGNALRIVAYSLSGAVIPAGVTEIADVDAFSSVAYVMLSDIDAQEITSPYRTDAISAVGANRCSFSISQGQITVTLAEGAQSLAWRIYGIDGRLLKSGIERNLPTSHAIIEAPAQRGTYLLAIEIDGNAGKVYKIKY